MDPILLKPGEVAMLLGIGRSKAYEMIASGAIPSIKLGKCVRVPAEGLRQWLQAQLASSEQGDIGPPEIRRSPR